MNFRQALVWLAALAVVLLTARLGMWQLDRAGQKTALQQSLNERSALPPLQGTSLAGDSAAALLQQHRQVSLTGRWLVAATVALDNRQMNGKPGVFVVTPLLLADGRAVVVQRGWLPRDFQDRSRVRFPPLPAGDVNVRGRIATPPARLYEFEGGASGPLRQNLVLEDFAREIRIGLLPMSVLQTVDAAAAPDGLLRDWPAPSLGVHKHQGYAFQWFAMSLLVAGLTIWFQLLRPRLQKRRHEQQT
jgi:surfeit locus 1 family protein